MHGTPLSSYLSIPASTKEAAFNASEPTIPNEVEDFILKAEIYAQQFKNASRRTSGEVEGAYIRYVTRPTPDVQQRGNLKCDAYGSLVRHTLLLYLEAASPGSLSLNALLQNLTTHGYTLTLHELHNELCCLEGLSLISPVSLSISLGHHRYKLNHNGRDYLIHHDLL